jgi:hypothetical protein
MLYQFKSLENPNAIDMNFWTSADPITWSRFGPRKLARALESCIPYLGHKASLKSSSSRPLSMHIAMSPHMKDFRQDLINSPLSAFPAGEGSSEKGVQKKECPRALLVEDNPINLKVSPLHVVLVTVLIPNFSSCWLHS